MTDDLLKSVMANVFETRAAKFYRECKAGKYPIPPIKEATDEERVKEFEIGDRVVTTGIGQYKAGLVFVVEDMHQEPTGYWKVKAGGLWHIRGDLAKAE